MKTMDAVFVLVVSLYVLVVSLYVLAIWDVLDITNLQERAATLELRTTNLEARLDALEGK